MPGSALTQVPSPALHDRFLCTTHLFISSQAHADVAFCYSESLENGFSGCFGVLVTKLAKMPAPALDVYSLTLHLCVCF